MAQKILKRSEVPVENTWNLADIFETDEAWLAEYESLKSVPEKVAAFAGRLSESAGSLLEYLKLLRQIYWKFLIFHIPI